MRKPRSINRINGAIAANATINFYKVLDHARHNWGDIGWRGKEHGYQYTYENGHIDKRRQTPIGNFIWFQAQRYYYDIMGLKGYSWTDESRSDKLILTFGEYEIFISLRLEANMDGIQLKVNAERNKHTMYFEPLRHKKFFVKSNDTFYSLNIVKYFEKKILRHYFHAPGIFQNIQIVWGLDKKQAIAKYKEIKAREAKQEPADRDEIAVKALIRRLNKHRNINVEDWLFTERELAEVFNSYMYQQQRKDLRKSPSPFAFLEEISSECDDEEEIMNAAQDLFYDKTVIFI